MMSKNKEILKACMQKGFLIDRGVLEPLVLLEDQLAKKLLNSFFSLNLTERVITKELFKKNCSSLLKLLGSEEDVTLAKNFLVSLGAEDCDFRSKEQVKVPKIDTKPNVKILSSPTIIPKKITVQDFVGHFRSRYEAIRSILLEKNLENIKSLRRIGRDRENYYIIVCIADKRITKNGNIILTVEDLNGQATVLVNNNKKELFQKAKEILLDEVVAIGVSGNNEMLFANDLVYPESVLPEKRRSDKEEIMAVISDIHVGSNMFFEENLLRFIDWLNGNHPDEDQRKIAKKVKYLLVVGDTVDGVGVFPDQEKFLVINDMVKQYEKLVEILSKIRQDIEIIISPGQHDAVWVGEPQPPIDSRWAPGLAAMPNVTLVTNPCMIELAGGFKVLMYHGASMHGIIEEIEEIRTKYGHRSPTRVVKEMLKRRHLSPMHGSCDYIPNEKRDFLTIDVVPDIVCTGDQHKTEISSYNNILLISSSCWQDKTPFEEKVGHEPDPCKVPIFNLKTREVKILDFSSSSDESN